MAHFRRPLLYEALVFTLVYVLLSTIVDLLFLKRSISFVTYVISGVVAFAIYHAFISFYVNYPRRKGRGKG